MDGAEFSQLGRVTDLRDEPRLRSDTLYRPKSTELEARDDLG